MIREIVTNPDSPAVRGKAKRVTRLDASIRSVLDDMVETMRAAPGVGLAAPQIGVPLRLIVVEYEEELFQVVNPEITKLKGAEEDEEGCLSIPNWLGPVTRATSLIVRGRDRDGVDVRIKAEGWLARIFQHEVDHLDGTLFIDRVEDRAALYWLDPDAPDHSDSVRSKRRRTEKRAEPKDRGLGDQP